MCEKLIQMKLIQMKLIQMKLIQMKLIQIMAAVVVRCCKHNMGNMVVDMMLVDI